MPQQAVKDFVCGLAVDKVVLTQSTFFVESQLLHNAARGLVFIVYKRDQLAQTCFNEDLVHEQLNRGSRDSPVGVLFADAVANFSVAHAVANVLERDVANHTFIPAYKPAVSLVFLRSVTSEPSDSSIFAISVLVIDCKGLWRTDNG